MSAIENRDGAGPLAFAAVGFSYVSWGLMPAYWKMCGGADGFVVLGHRAVWTALFVALALAASGRAGAVAATVARIRADARSAALFALLVLMAAINWWVNAQAAYLCRIVEIGAGQFLTPLMTVALGVICFKERLTRAKRAGLALAAAGLAVMVAGLPSFPWLTLTVSSSWAVYSAAKRKLQLNPAASTMLEALAMAPLAAAYLTLTQDAGGPGWTVPGDAAGTAALVGTGVVTSLPLITYAYAANAMPLNVLGFCQYLSPMLAIGLGVLVYGEAFGGARLAAMAFVWAGIAAILAEQARQRRPAP